MWETKINPFKVFELRCKNTTYFGIGAINKIGDILEDLKKRGINKVILITGKSSYKISGAWDVVRPALEEKKVDFCIYDKVGPNPTVDMIEEAVEMAKSFGAQAVIGIGGGSPIDTAKSVAVLLEYKDRNARELYEQKFAPEKAVPIIAINLTHGTGTEVDRFAVATIPEKNYKPAIAYDCIYPLYSIDDPQLMTKLDKTQTVAVTVDALNHITEASTTLVASPYSILTAQETVRLIAKYLPVAINEPQNLIARYYLLYASALAGISFDNGLLHLTHALEHPLSAVKPELPHGLGLGALLPAIIKTIYPYQAEVLASVYEPIVPNLKGVPSEAEFAAKKVEEWLFTMGCDKKLSDFGFSQSDVDNLVDLALETPSLGLLLSMSPVKATKEVIKKIYEESLYPMK
ncbi:iron-containing alcohol dehydrogenase [Caldicellulosiruptor naganoensis]|uniref:Iron-containing alcohol dehydrogenase n=1 Tax=Caldicellulosiruptor naganoensis TaxID=29324 RepID=A0ABY7BGH4_9FIRM|nr:iron-containing alcohol dehydrogenase [Caldicellulosiruptor naganoensis]WAM31909.1 iron-containing alcohol dehydrogenase [Caldicellulosiruptor naganoensis]